MPLIVYLSDCVCLYMSVCNGACLQVFVCVCVCIYECMRVSIWVCVCGRRVKWKQSHNRGVLADTPVPLLCHCPPPALHNNNHIHLLWPAYC